MADDLSPLSSSQSTNTVFSRKVYYDGNYIFRQGDVAYTAFFMDTGNADVVMEEDGHEVVIGNLKQGDIFGEMAIIDPSPRSASVIARGTCTAIELSEQELMSKIDMIDNKPMQQLFKILVRRLRQSNQEQFDYSKNLAQFKTRMIGVVKSVAEDIPPDQKDNFKEEALPFLDTIEDLIRKYSVK